MRASYEQLEEQLQKEGQDKLLKLLAILEKVRMSNAFYKEGQIQHAICE